MKYTPKLTNKFASHFKVKDIHPRIETKHAQGILEIMYELSTLLADIVGMDHIKYTLLINDENLPVKNIMRSILKVSSNMKADDVLREMKRSKTHLALLQDKDGKTLGLVSMEDLIEEIFGEITDEHDKKI